MKLRDISTLAERLKYIRRMHNLSQTQLAEKAETSQQTIQQAEAGKAQNPRYLYKLSKVLNIPYEWLSMNIMPDDDQLDVKSMAEREVLSSFFSMPKADQDRMLEQMKSRGKNSS